MIERSKVLSYITRGSYLLVFTHPDSPEAGIQVPGGTPDPGERIEDAALREAIEETGLAGLRLSSYLGDMRRDMSDFGLDEIHHRYFFHVWCDEEAPPSWRHGEFTPGDSSGRVDPIPFDFYWANLAEGVPPLIANQGAYIPKLASLLGL
jgi:8-oxo-dGTP diphosphatase